MKVAAGLEINEQYLKLVVAQPQVKNTAIAECAVEPVSSLSDEQISQAITAAAKKIRLKFRSLAVSLPRNSVTVRNLHLPSQDPNEVSQMIGLHIGRIVPYKKEETVFGYQVLGTDEMGYTKVVLAIVQSNAVRRQIKILEKAGLLIDRIGLSSYGAWQWALARQQAQIAAGELYLLLDVDSNFSDFIIFSKDNLLFTRSINIGASDIQDNKELGLAKLLGEAKQSLIIFNNEEVNKKPAGAFLAGASAVGALRETVEGELGIPVNDVPSPYPAEPAAAGKAAIPENVSLSGVSELALEERERRIYFLLPEIQISKSLKEKTADLIILGACALYMLSVICAVFLGRIYNQQNYLRQLGGRSAAIEKEMGGLSSQLGRIEFIKGYLGERRGPLLAVYQLQEVIPQEIAVNFLGVEGRGVVLRGQAQQLSDVFKFVTSLEELKSFRDIQTKYTRKKKVKDKEITDFELNFSLAD